MEVQMLRDKINNRTAVIGVIGLGYVGLPLAAEFTKCGFETIGIDIDKTKVNRAVATIRDISSKAKTDFWQNKFTATSDFNTLKNVDVCIICVPSPLSSISSICCFKGSISLMSLLRAIPRWC